MIITPGYIFGTTEIPNRAKFLLQASGLGVTDIPASAFGDIFSLVVSETNPTTISAEGMLWIDAKGNLWGRNAQGTVCVRSVDGGWETNRFAPDIENTAGWPAYPRTPGLGWGVLVDTGGSCVMNMSDVVWARPFVNQATTVTNSFPRMKVRGRTPWRHAAADSSPELGLYWGQISDTVFYPTLGQGMEEFGSPLLQVGAEVNEMNPATGSCATSSYAKHFAPVWRWS